MGTYRLHKLLNLTALFAGIVYTAAALPASSQYTEFYVKGKRVSERVYRAVSLTNEAVSLADSNRLTEAREKLLAAIRLAPDLPEARNNLGVLLTRLGKPEEAVEHFKAVVVSQVDLPTAWASLGAIYVNAGKYEEAMAVFNDAVSRFPEKTWQQIPTLYSNYGVLLGKLGRNDEAIEQFKGAIRANAEVPYIWMNLGLLYQANGKLEDSIEHYREFIRRAPDDPQVPVIIDTIKMMDGELRVAKSRPSGSEEDYYFEVTRDGPRSWSPKSMPLRVYIHPGHGISGFETRYYDILKEAFDEWSRASQGKVSIKFVDPPFAADIECSWTSDPTRLRNRSEGGETDVYFQQNGLLQRVSILILTVPAGPMNSITDNVIRSVSLHEVGHALGLIAHSSNPADVMFFSIAPTDAKRSLSARDRKTLVRLYSRK